MGIINVSPLLQVKDLKVSLSFYIEKLGFKLNIEDDGFAILSRDTCMIFLAAKEVDVDLRNQTARIEGSKYANYDLHFNLSSGTIDLLWKEYKDKAVPMPAAFNDGPVTRDYGVTDFSVTDPDGYDLVFAEFGSH